jgi:integrase
MGATDVEVLGIDLPWLNDVNRPTRKPRIPSALTRDEVAGLLAHMDRVPALIAKLLYGTGMRLMEGMRLRIKDVDFDCSVIVMREAKGGKDWGWSTTYAARVKNVSGNCSVAAARCTAGRWRMRAR